MQRGILRSITLFIFVIALLAALGSGAQQVVNVNTYTGSVSASIPLWQVTAGPLRLPVALNYGSSGIRVDQKIGAAGIGWNVSASGRISRAMRDLPDDLNDVNTTVGSRYGWLYGSTSSASKVDTFVTGNVNTPDCVSDAYGDLSGFGGLDETNDLIDMEPDVFRISVPGHLNVSFTFDASGAPVVLDNQELTITPSFLSDGTIDSFVVTANGGVQYEFSLQTSTTITLKGINQTAVDYTDADVDYFRRAYFMYKPGLTYNNIWALDRIVAPTGEEILFSYQSAQTIIQDDGFTFPTSPTQYDTMNVYLYNPGTLTHEKNTQFVTKSESTHSKRLVKIKTRWETLNFTSNGVVLPKGDYDLKYPLVTGLSVTDNHTSDVHTSYQLKYTPLKGGKDPILYSHIFLSSLEIRGSTQAYSQYQFNYYGVDLDNNKWEFVGLYEDEDIYGYHSDNSGNNDYRKLYMYPNEVGSERYRTDPILDYSSTLYETDGMTSQSVNPGKLSAGILKNVVLPSGGSENLTYEPNRYFDSLSNEDAYGGGLRVSKLRIHDGVSYDNDQEVTYSYLDDQGQSSGKLLYRPVYHQRLPYHQSPTSGNLIHYDSLLTLGLSTTEIWKRTLMMTNQDLTESYHPGYTVGYTQVETQRPGVGSSTTRYLVSTDLANAHLNYDRPLRTSTSAPASPTPICYSGLDQYDFPNIDYLLNLRFSGLPLSSEQRDVLDLLVSEQTFTYETIGTATSVNGLVSVPVTMASNVSLIKANAILNTFLYHPYTVPYGIRMVRKSSTSKTFDPSGNGELIPGSSDLTYDASGKVITSSRTDRDGQEYLTRVSYSDSYSIIRPVAEQSVDVQALSKLVENKQDVPIETVSIIKIGTEELVTGARLSIWEVDASGNLAFPKSSYVFRIGAPVNDFFYSSVVDNGTTETFTFDPRYQKVSTVESRNASGKVISETGFGQTAGTVRYAFDGHRASLQVSGVTDEEIVFDDFEDFQAQLDGNTSLPAGRLGGFGYSLDSQAWVKSFTNQSSSDYVFSCWIKASTAGQLTVKVLATTKTVAFAANSTNWIYYQVEVPSSGAVGQLINLELTSDVATVIDEVAYYPSDAAISYTHFGTNYRKVAETDTYGNTSTISYDFAGRVEAVRDKDANIIKTFEYALASSSPPSLQLPLLVQKDKAATFSVEWADNCSQFRWKFDTEANYIANTAGFVSSLAAQPIATFSVNQTFSTVGRWVVAVGMDCDGVWEQLNDEVQVFEVYSEEPKWMPIGLCADRPETVDWCDPVTFPAYISGCSASEILNVVQINVTNLPGSGPYSYKWKKADWQDYFGGYQYLNEDVILVSGTSTQYDESYLNEGADIWINKAIRCEIIDLVTNQIYYTPWKRFLGYYSDPNCPQQ